MSIFKRLQFLFCKHEHFHYHYRDGEAYELYCIECGAVAPILTVQGRWRLP